MVQIFRDLTSANAFTRSWLPDFTFAIDPMSPRHIRQLQMTGGVDVHFDHVHWDHQGFLVDYLNASDRSNHLVTIEHKSLPRSRVRSHSGLFADYPAIRKSEHAQFEIPLDEPYTHLVGIVRVTRDNARECVRLLGDATRACIVATKAGLDALATAQSLIRAVPGLPGPAYFNYAVLVEMFCLGHDRILRFGGYSGNGDANVQVFAPVGDIEDVANELRGLLKASEL